MTEPWRILKFGGTSVSGKPQWETIASLARQRLDDGYRVLLVCSAVSGVTNALQALADNAKHGDAANVLAIIKRHSELTAELNIEADDLLIEAADKISHELA